MADRFASPPRVLCLDGGGIRGLSEILILKDLMLQVRLRNKLNFTPEPRQCFDFICGTEAGGLIAILLGRLGMSLAECEEVFRAVGPGIFSQASPKTSLRQALLGSQWASDRWDKTFTALVGRESMNESGLAAPGQVPVAVVAVSRPALDDHLLRTYSGRANSKDWRIAEACRATTLSSPPTTINGVNYVSGVLGRNNPSSLALEELELDTWLSPLRDAVDEVGCFVSIGTGRPTLEGSEDTLKMSLTPKGIVSARDALSLCSLVTTDSDAEHRRIQKRFVKAGREDVYFRFDVDAGLESHRSNVSDQKALQHTVAITNSYLQRAEGRVARCALMLGPEARK